MISEFAESDAIASQKMTGVDAGTALAEWPDVTDGVSLEDRPDQLRVTIHSAATKAVSGLFSIRRRFEKPVGLRLDPDALIDPDAIDRLVGEALDSVLDDSIRLRATHVHLEPNGDRIRLLIRIGGVLRVVLIVEDRLGRAMIQRVAGQATLARRTRRPGEAVRHYVPMSRSGAFAVAHLTCLHGDRVVLTPTQGHRRMSSLTDLGTSIASERAMADAIAEPNGLILIAGLNHSGRRETLRAMMADLADQGRSVLSIDRERIGGHPAINQIVLEDDSPSRRIDRIAAAIEQDPDVIVIDSIPDRATADLIVDTAMGRRLVLARINASDAMAAIEGLRSLRVDPFLIASALRAVTAQRLTRRLCSECRTTIQAPTSVSALLGFDPGTIVFEPRGCSACDGKGFDAPVAVFEVVRADPTIRRLINSGGDAAILARHAFVNAPNLGSAARTLVREGVITAEDAVKLSRGQAMAI